MQLKADGRWFKDEQGRTVFLRGVNLGGSSKMPTQPNGATHLKDGFFDRENISFVGRPFPLEEADEHFGRLKHWGLDFLRFVVTWEALEHDGPGIYDEDYFDYLEAIIEKAYEYDIRLFIDPHQDVWSRFSGGDGAPAWTFDAVGIDITQFKKTEAATVHQTYDGELPSMIWATNYNKFASQTMFTLFFGGNDFAPTITYEDQPIQEFLQTHYINAFQHLAERIGHLPNVVGFGTMNEPHNGLIGLSDIREYGHVLVKFGVTPTPAQAIFLASGFPQECAEFKTPLSEIIPNQVNHKTIDPEGSTVWKDGYEDIWKQQGVWDTNKEGDPRLLRPAYFARVNGEAVDFNDDYLRPFAEKFSQAIRDVMPDAYIFIESEPFEPPPNFENTDNLVYAPHFYEGVTLFTKRFNRYLNADLERLRPLIGVKAIEDYITRRIGTFREFADEHMGDVPIIVGEFGIPFDMNNKYAYETGDFTPQAMALEYNLQAMDDHLMNYTLWNYTSDNTNEHGDLWNGEDLSIFSRDQQTDPSDINSGGRALSAVVRPYAQKVAGEPLNMRFDPERGLFTFSFRHDNDITEPTEIFVPNSQFPAGYRVEVSDGEYEIKQDEQTVIYRHTDKNIPHMVRVISNTPPPTELSPLNKIAIIAGIFLFVIMLLGRGGNKKDKS
jgi:hypothetical protein